MGILQAVRSKQEVLALLREAVERRAKESGTHTGQSLASHEEAQRDSNELAA